MLKSEITDPQELVHIWHRCHSCEMQPIVGLRYECQSCPAGPENDLCANCYERLASGAIRHPNQRTILISKPHIFHAKSGLSASSFKKWFFVEKDNSSFPRPPYQFVLRPEFCCGLRSYFGSYAFAVQLDSGSILLLTALHVMDELIKAEGIDCTPRNNSYSGNEIPSILTKVNLYDIFASNWMCAEVGSAHSMLVLPNARIGDEEPYSQRDIAAFCLESKFHNSPAKLAATRPEVGEPVWLVVRSTRKAQPYIQKAVVVESTESTLIFRYAAPIDLPPFTSGAPLIDREGSVVGINIGGGYFQGQRFGHGNHVTSIRNHLLRNLVV